MSLAAAATASQVAAAAAAPSRAAAAAAPSRAYGRTGRRLPCSTRADLGWEPPAARVSSWREPGEVEG